MSLFLAAVALGAAEAAPAELPRLEVSATPIVRTEVFTKDGAEMWQVGREQLALQNSRDLQGALRRVPGVTISRYSPVGSYGGAQGGSIYVRGLGTARPGGDLRIMMDGAPRGSGVWSHPLLDSLPVEFLEEVSVQKSPHPAHLADAFAGVEMRTRRRREEGYEAETDLAYGRYGSFFTSLSAGVKEGIIDGYGGLAYKRSQGLRVHSDAQAADAFGRVGIDLSETANLNFLYTHTESRTEDPGPTGLPPPRLDRFDLGTDLYSVRFELNEDFLEGESILYFEHGAIAWHKDHLSDGNLMSPAGDADTTWLNFGTRHRYTAHLAGAWDVTGALDVMSERGHTANTREDNHRRVFGFKGQMLNISGYGGTSYAWRMGAWTLTPAIGARVYHHTIYSDESAPTGSLTLDYDEKVTAFVTASRAVHYPGIYTRAVSPTFAREAIDAETMNYLSTGLRFHPFEDWQASVSFFRRETDNQVERTTLGYLNVGEQRAHGVETSAQWDPFENLSFFGSLCYTCAETHPASRLPEWTATLAATWKPFEWLSLTLDGQYIGAMRSYSVRMPTPAATQKKLDDGILVNFRAGVPFSLGERLTGEAYVALENLTGTHYEYYPGYPIGGMMWTIGCRLNW